jgi:uncharacterized protein YdeI (BOF family)
MIVSSIFVFSTAYASAPKHKRDGSWLTVNGTVAKTTNDGFLLDYGKGLITVDMDNWDWFPKGRKIIDGDKVTVYGRIDDGFYEARTIEAGSLYVDNLNTVFHANDVKDEDAAYLVHPHALVASWMIVTGTVTSVDGREFTIDTGKRKLKIDTSRMSYNPMDNLGFQRISKGDRVRASGRVDYDVFEKRKIMADSIITLAENRKSSG